MNKLLDQMKDIIDARYSYLDDMWDEIQKMPDDEQITLSAGTLKRFCRTYNALLSYLNKDMDKVAEYLDGKN